MTKHPIILALNVPQWANPKNLVENTVIVELKTVLEFNDVHLAQILTYLKFSEKHVGLLLNFNVKSLRYGVKRVSL